MKFTKGNVTFIEKNIGTLYNDNVVAFKVSLEKMQEFFAGVKTQPRNSDGEIDNNYFEGLLNIWFDKGSTKPTEFQLLPLYMVGPDKDDYGEPINARRYVNKELADYAASLMGLDERFSSDLCEWFEYDRKTLAPKKCGGKDPYWKVPARKGLLKYCPYCGKQVVINGLPINTYLENVNLPALACKG